MSETNTAQNEFPTADVKAVRAFSLGTLSSMWLLTLACVAFAIGLTWYSLDDSGIAINIRFSEGHGLKEGDPVRYRGIEVGHVTGVVLSEDLSSIDVAVELKTSAASIASQGSRFWIVRPEIGLTGVRGLETAVGSKYIAVIPGESNAHQTQFDGLASRPPSSVGQTGIEIVLRGNDRHGVNPGSPVTWRGVEVGQVIRSSLSTDGMHVDTRIRIQQPYQRLLSPKSKFWVTSGVHFDVGVTGVKIDTETLDEIARGGVAFITPGGGDPSKVFAGEVFRLYEKEDADWIAASEPTPLLKRKPPASATVVAKWQQKHFGITRSHQAAASAVTIGGPGGTRAIFPKDTFAGFADAIGGSEAFFFRDGSGNEVKMKATDIAQLESEYLAAVRLENAESFDASAFENVRFRQPNKPEDCFAVRQIRSEAGGAGLMIEPLGAHEMADAGDYWTADVAHLDRETWHGAAVVSAEDEKVIGLLLISDEVSGVAKLDIDAEP